MHTTTEAASSLESTGRSERAPLLALALATFVFGTAELVIVGVLDRLALDLEVSVGAAGQTVAFYGIGIALGGPALTMVTIGWPRRRVLVASLVGFCIANAVAAAAPTYAALLAARFASGALHGLFVGAAFVVAIMLVDPSRMGRAIAAVLSGIAVAAAVGVPLGTFIGRSTDWRSTFGTIVGLSVLVLVLVLTTVPRLHQNPGGRLSDQAPHAFAPKVLAMLGVAFLIMGGQFVGLTYLTPYLRDEVGVSDGAIPLFILAYGAAVAVGTLFGGRAADVSARGTLVIGSLGVIAAVALVFFGRDVKLLVALGLILWGLAGFGLVPSFQHRVVTLAGPGRELASGLPASTAAAGIAAGAAIGGLVVEDAGVIGTMWVSLLVTVVALLAAAATWGLRDPE